MKFLKTTFSLFFALYIPLMLLAMFVLKPRDPKISAMQAALGAAPFFAILMLAISLGFATLTFVMDAQKRAHELVEEAKTPTPKLKKKKKKK